MTQTYFTVFDKNYAARGLVMIESLRRVSCGDLRVVVLALDDDANRVSRECADDVLSIDDIGDMEFVEARANRSYEEFCWTCAPVLSNFLLQRSTVGDYIAYLDADLYFFSDPRILFEEMQGGGQILIHPHRFSPDKAQWEKSAGKFNVGFVGFRVSEEARTCVARWREQVLSLCVLDPDQGLCGDQGYLNEWPDLYPGLRVMQNIGGGTAPWNVSAYKVGPGPLVDGVPIVFFHFHKLRVVDCDGYRFQGAIPAFGYTFQLPVIDLIYRDYLKRLKGKSLVLARSGIPLRTDQVSDFGEFRHYLAIGHVVLVLEGWMDTIRWYSTLLRNEVRRRALRRMKKWVPWRRPQ